MSSSVRISPEPWERSHFDCIEKGTMWEPSGTGPEPADLARRRTGVSRPVKLTLWGAALGLLPFLIFVGATSYSMKNGVVTSYTYLNLAAIAGGIGAVCLGVALVRRGSRLVRTPPRPGWAVPVCVALILLGVFQVVRGFGALPELTGCVSESGSAGFCVEVPESALSGTP